MSSDADLIRRCLAQDGRAWAEFVDRFSSVIYWAIKTRLSRYRYPYLDRDIADIYQIVITSLWSGGKLQALKNHDILSTYLVTISSNAAIDFMRRRKKDLIIERALTERSEAAAAESLDESLIRNDMRNIIFEALKQLKERDRVIMELNYLHDRTHKEIAGMLNMPVHSVSTIIRRARERIRAALEDKKSDIF